MDMDLCRRCNRLAVLDECGHCEDCMVECELKPHARAAEIYEEGGVGASFSEIYKKLRADAT